MSGFNGSGTFNISSVGLPYVSGTTISSLVANTLNTDLAAGLSNCITKDGQQTLTANIPFGGYKITGLGVGSASADSASIYNIQCNTGAFITVTGTDTLVGTATPALTAGYVTGMQFQFFVAGTNTGAVTLSISGQGAKAVTKNGTTALVAGDIPSGVLVTVTYDGTRFVLNNQSIFGAISTGAITVTGNITVSGDSAVSGNITVSGDSAVSGNSTVTGDLTVDGNINCTNLLTGYKNRIINGGMDISQRGTSFALTSSPNGTYTLDRWAVGFSGTMQLTVTQDSNVPSDNEFQSSLKIAVAAADTSITNTDFAQVQQMIEGYNVRDLIGQDFTISFWVKSSVTGTYCVGLENAGVPGTFPPDKSYVATYTITAANIWEYKTITVTGGLITSGTWNWTNGVGLRVTFALAAGSNYQTTANAWKTGNYIGTSAQVNAVSSTSNVFAITGVQLEAGAVDTNYEHRAIGLEAELCERYYQVVNAGVRGWPTFLTYVSNGDTRGAIYWRITMRAAPSVTFSTTVSLSSIAIGYNTELINVSVNIGLNTATTTGCYIDVTNSSSVFAGGSAAVVWNTSNAPATYASAELA